MQLLEFFDPSQPRSKDGKWSKWGSHSANPDLVGDRAQVQRPWDDTADAKTLRAFVGSLFDHKLPDGYRSSGELYEVSGNPVVAFLVKGGIYNSKGQTVATFERGVSYRNGRLVVSHERLSVNFEHQGKGIADAFVKQSMVAYHKAGVSEVQVDATLAVGGYAWARQGFRIRGGESYRRSKITDLLERVEFMVQQNLKVSGLSEEALDSVSREVAALRAASDAGEDVQPRHIASIGRAHTWVKDGKTMWAGKSGLLGSSWQGHFIINPEPGSEDLSALDVVEFFDPSQPRDKDGKWKRWSGVSATPEARVPVSRLPVDKEWLDDEGFESEEAFLSSWYSHDLPGGYRSEVSTATPALDKFGSAYGPKSTGPARWKVEGTILTPSGHEAGRFKRKIDYNPETRELTVTHDILVLHPEHQGKGIADAFNAQSVQQYQRYGVRAIRLHAAMDVGGYAWARQGFRIFPEEEREREINRLIKRAEHALEDAYELTDESRLAIRKEIGALKMANAAGEDVQPIHIASLGERVQQYQLTRPGHDPYQSWVGKSALMGSGWMGHFILDPDAPVVGSSTCLRHVHLRPAYGASDELMTALARRLTPFSLMT
jgi:GNAT superfamily N-acetyltransferase